MEEAEIQRLHERINAFDRLVKTKGNVSDSEQIVAKFFSDAISMLDKGEEELVDIEKKRKLRQEQIR